MSEPLSIAIPWIVVGASFIGVIIVCFIFTRIFKDAHETARIPTIVTTLGLAAILVCLAAIPIDIFNISYTDNPQRYVFAVRILYSASYITLLLFAFILIPFAYFFYEEDGERVSLGARIWGASKYTIFTLIAALLVIILGLTLRFGSENITDDSLDWLKSIIDADNYGEQAIGFMVSCMALVGLIPWNTYAAYGLAALPIGLIKGKKRISGEMDDVKYDLDTIERDIREINEKYEISGKSMSRSDKKLMSDLRRRERALKHRSRRLVATSKNWTTRLSGVTYPIRLLLGLVFLGAIVFMMIGLFLGTLDRTLNSTCTFSCGFLTEITTIPNPLDLLLTYSSIAFPVDYILVAILALLILLGCITGIANIGVRFLCIKMYKLRVRRTAPQGLLTACIILMFSVLVFSVQFISFAPQYATFGSQQVIDHDGVLIPCNYQFVANYSNPNSSWFDPDFIGNHTIDRDHICFMSELAKIVHGVSGRISFFGIVYYFSNWLFIAAFLLSILISLIRKPASYADVDSSDDEDDPGQDL